MKSSFSRSFSTAASILLIALTLLGASFQLQVNKYLKETTVPAGYNSLNAAIKVVIGENGALTQDGDATSEVKIQNNAGTTLPETGGIGTTLFYVFGGILMAAAAVLLITKRRMNTAE